MSSPPAVAATSPLRAPWRTLVLDLVLAAGLVALFAILARPGRASWFHEDDFRNLRWVMEYHAAPWLALTERHALHGHVRPLVDLALWAVTPLDGDPYPAQLGLLLGLQAAGLLGLGALALRLGATRRVALLAMAFGASLHGFQLLGTWVAWVCSAGQIAAGLWALVAWDRALAGGRGSRLATGAAVLLAVAAGLFKEPGWILVPAGALALASARGRLSWRWLGFVAIGGAGLAYAWHPDNQTRFLTGSTSFLDRLWTGLQVLPAADVQSWPLWRISAEAALPGLPLLIVTAVLATDLVAGPAGWALWVASAAVGYGAPSLLGPAVYGLAALVVLKQARKPPVGLVLFLLETAIALPLDIRNEVQVLTGGFGLALHVALATPRLFAAPTPRVVRLVTGAALAVWAASVGIVASRITPNVVSTALHDRDRLAGLAALVAAMGPSEAVVIPADRPSDELLPLTGLYERGQLARPAAVSIGDYLLLNPPPGAIERSLLAMSRVSPSSIPRLGESSAARDDLTRDAGPRPLDPGYYAIGIMPARTGGRTFQSALHAMDGCGNRWTAASPAEDVSIGIEIVHLRAECPGLRLGWTGPRTLEAMFLLAPLPPDPRFGFRSALPIPRHLDVRVQADPSLQGEEAADGTPSQAPPATTGAPASPGAPPPQGVPAPGSPPP